MLPVRIFVSFTIATVTILNKNYFNWSQILCYSSLRRVTLPTVKMCKKQSLFCFCSAVVLPMRKSPVVSVTVIIL